MDYQHSPLKLYLGIALSLVVHGVVAGFIFLSQKQAKASRAPKNIVSAVLVRKGTPRAKHLLPRIYRRRPPPSVRKRVVARKSRKKKKTRRRPRRRRLSTAELLRRAERRIREYRRRRLNEEDKRGDDVTPPGVANGSEHGTVSDPRLARMGMMYGVQLRARIEQFMKIPSIFNRDQIEQYKKNIEIAISIDRSGRLLSARVSKSSGNARFDSAVLSGVRRASPFPKPPDRVWPIVRPGIDISW